MIKKTLCILLVVLIGIGLVFECLFFSFSRRRLVKQYEIDNFIEYVETEYSSVKIFQLYEDTLMFKISSETDIIDAENIILDFERWGRENHKGEFVRRIKFLDENVSDSFIPRDGDCVIEFYRDSSQGKFITINIYKVNASLFPQFSVFSSYGKLSRKYNFNVFTEVKIDSSDNIDVISQWYCNLALMHNENEYLHNNGVLIVEERSDKNV